MKTLLASTAAAAALLASAAVAQEGETRQLGAHVHGEARLSVAIDPDTGLALAELAGAAWNFYGFERAPQTEAERETVAAVRTALAQDGVIAWPDRAGCTLSEVTVDAVTTGAGEDHGHDHGDHGHEDHGHEDHDHGDHGHEHEEDHSHDHGAGAGHNDVAASWTFQCDRVAAADRFDAAGLFAALPRLERINAEAFDGGRAAVRTLTGEDAVVRLE